MVKIASSFGIRSSCLNSSMPVRKTLVLRSSPNFSFRAISSSFTTAKILTLLESSSVNCLMISNFSANSSSIFLRSMPASVCKRISKIALACFSESLNFFIKFPWASSLVGDLRMVSMTASMWSRAILSPSRI